MNFFSIPQMKSSPGVAQQKTIRWTKLILGIFDGACEVILWQMVLWSQSIVCLGNWHSS